MKRLVLTALAVLLASPGAGLAALGDSSLYWAVPGVMHTGTLTTVFQCSNPSTTNSYSMGVEVFRADGTLAGSTSTVLVAPGATATVSTQLAQSLLPADYTNLAISGSPNVLGSARVGVKQLICAAWVMGTGITPGYMNSLPIIQKAKQRGQ